MRQTELHLTEEDRAVIEGIRTKGLHQSREVNRAHVLASLDQGIPEVQIRAVLGMGRTAVRRTCRAESTWPCSTLRDRVDLPCTTQTPKLG